MRVPPPNRRRPGERRPPRLPARRRRIAEGPNEEPRPRRSEPLRRSKPQLCSRRPGSPLPPLLGRPCRVVHEGPQQIGELRRNHQLDGWGLPRGSQDVQVLQAHGPCVYRRHLSPTPIQLPRSAVTSSAVMRHISSLRKQLSVRVGPWRLIGRQSSPIEISVVRPWPATLSCPLPLPSPGEAWQVPYPPAWILPMGVCSRGRVRAARARPRRGVHL